jgi:hypothetical protein
MKKLFVIATLFAGLQFISANGSAQVYVHVRPEAPVYVRPQQPRPEHIWIEPEWVWRGGRYENVQGYWAPPRPGYRYSAGYWRHSRRGEMWVGGGWRR